MTVIAKLGDEHTAVRRDGPSIDSTILISILEVDITIHSDEHRSEYIERDLKRSNWIDLSLIQDQKAVADVISSVNVIMMVDEESTRIPTNNAMIRKG